MNTLVCLLMMTLLALSAYLERCKEQKQSTTFLRSMRIKKLSGSGLCLSSLAVPLLLLSINQVERCVAALCCSALLLSMVCRSCLYKSRIVCALALACLCGAIVLLLSFEAKWTAALMVCTFAVAIQCTVRSPLAKCFSLGELCAVGQLAAIGVTDALTMSPVGMVDSLIVALTIGMLLVGVMLHRWIAVGDAWRFMPAFVALVGGVVMPWLWWCTGEANAWRWAVDWIVGSSAHAALFVYWLMLLVAALAALGLHAWWATRFPLIVVRKFYHILAVAMFAPAVVAAPDFLALSYAVATSGLLFAEYLRVGRMPPLGTLLHQFVEQFVDVRDCGPLVLTHLYLLLGCAVPLWIDRSSTSTTSHPLAPFSGILILGIGDAFASLVGIYAPRRLAMRWPYGSRKTFVGTLGGFAAVVVASISLEQYIYSVDHHHHHHSSMLPAIVASGAAMLLEAATDQIDNLFLPIIFHSILLFMNEI